MQRVWHAGCVITLISHKQTRTHTYGRDVSSEIPYQMGHTQSFAADKQSCTPDQLGKGSTRELKVSNADRLALVPPFPFVAVEANGRPSLPQVRTKQNSRKSRGGGAFWSSWSPCCVHAKTSSRTYDSREPNHPTPHSTPGRGQWGIAPPRIGQIAARGGVHHRRRRDPRWSSSAATNPQPRAHQISRG